MKIVGISVSHLNYACGDASGKHSVTLEIELAAENAQNALVQVLGRWNNGSGESVITIGEALGATKPHSGYKEMPAPAEGGNTSSQNPTASAPAAAPSRRRRASTVPTAEPASQSTAAEPVASPSDTTAAPSTGRRRRGNAMERGSGAPDPTSDAPSVAAGGRKARSSASTVEAKSPSDGKITDADLTKAASEAAQRIGNPKKVIDVLHKFGVTNLAQLPAEKRREFLDALLAVK